MLTLRSLTGSLITKFVFSKFSKYTNFEKQLIIDELYSVQYAINLKLICNGSYGTAFLTSKLVKSNPKFFKVAASVLFL